MRKVTIDSFRRRIDELDTELVTLLSERATCALGIGRIKETSGQAVYQPGREADVLARVRASNPGPLDDRAITRLFERIIDEARRLERQVHAETGGRADETTER